MAEALVRLNKFLSVSGICSRREADEHILAGRVTVNGTRAELGTKIDSRNDVVAIDGKEVNPNSDAIYYVLYKPRGVISTSDDELKRKTALDFVPKEPRVYTVGRLDADSEGLIILTNDGELTQKLTHPSFEHEKEYEVKVRIKYYVSSIKEEIIKEIIQAFSNGLVIDGHLMRADNVNVRIIHNTKYLILTLALHTGYNRQIRKMCAKIGLQVNRLIRIRIGKLKLADLNLKPGEFKVIKKEDII